MSYGSELTRQRILECAKDEFLSRGFQEANLRRIASEAKTTTGALYYHFDGKDALFDALVADAARGLKRLFHRLHGEETTTSLPEAEAVSFDGTRQVLSYIYDHLDAFRLLFLASEGSAYGKFLEELSREEERQLIKLNAAARKSPSSGIDELFLCHITRHGYRALYEVVSSDLGYEEALQFMDRTFRFRMGGWHALRS